MDQTPIHNVTAELTHLCDRTVGINEETGAALHPVELIEITNALETQDEASPHTWLHPGVRVLLVYASDKDRTGWYVGLMRLIGHGGYICSSLATLDDLNWNTSAQEGFTRNLDLTVGQVNSMARELVPESIPFEEPSEPQGPLMDLSLARNVTAELIDMRQRILCVHSGTRQPICPMEMIDITDVLGKQGENSPHYWLRPNARIVLVYASTPDAEHWFAELHHVYPRGGGWSVGFVPLDDLTWKEGPLQAVHRKTGMNEEELRGLIQDLVPSNVRRFLEPQS